MQRPSGSYAVKPWRGGDEGDLLKQALLLELCELLTTQRGEFWFIMAGLEQQEGVRIADIPALDWCAVAEGAGSQSLWQHMVLWKTQRPYLLRGECLSAMATIFHQLESWNQRGVSGRLVMVDREPASWAALGTLRSMLHTGMGEWESNHWPFRVYEISGEPAQILRDMAFGGVIRGPGLACLHLPEAMPYAGSWVALVETLLLRQIWVMVVIPPVWISGPKIIQKTVYRRFRDAIEQICYPGILYQLKERSLSARPHQLSEMWLFSPEMNLQEVGHHLGQICHNLLVRGLGREARHGEISGLRVEPIFGGHTKSMSFRASLPQTISESVSMALGHEYDIPDVVKLWEQLMDEHAQLDSHFRRRSLAGVHLRQSLLSQLTQPDHLLLVAKQNTKIVGFLTAQVLHTPLFHSSRIGQIVDIFVVPALRSQGIGQAFVSLAMQWFESVSLTQVDLNVAVDNEQGYLFWKKQGFQPYLHVTSRLVKDTKQ